MKALFVGLLFVSNMAMAARCNFSINREACPGREQEAYAPYGGQNPTASLSMVNSENACLDDAKNLSKVLRKGLIKKITVTATYNEKTLDPVFSEKPCSN